MWMFGAGMSGSAKTDEARNADTAQKDGVVIMISTFILQPQMEDAFLSWWRLAKPIIAAQPGFVSASLLRSLDPREGLRYANITEWRGAAAYRDALAKLWSSGPPPVPGIDWRPQMYEVMERT